ncbi:DUF3987 domain-containing protein [Vibrio mediterranei]|uniref:DUF3987 domain-containing protein n=1 Tax=Vibrio mediterranei TaxID=689 RepID=UPI001EFE2D67|nr:DUF3987 domain-containing protein [Vibrio mediterranei]MCG9665819.1 DUF3987 domain-containing protein [Vibrio mediterranei]
MLKLKSIFSVNHRKSNKGSKVNKVKVDTTINKTHSPIENSDLCEPKLNPVGMYGILQIAVDVICDKTEALPTSLMAEIMSWISVSIPRGSVYLPYGTGTTEARVNVIVVAPTGEGKGIATRQFGKVRELIELNNAGLYCPVFQGGLSTPEGLISMIRDNGNDDKDTELEDSLGSQLLVIEEEMASIFALANNPKSNFSPYFRTFFDGTPVAPLTKYNKIACNKPHVAFYGHITPQELLTVVKTVDMFNGFLNRFPIYYSKREKSVPIPEGISKSLVEGLASGLAEILTWVKVEDREMKRSECFIALWEDKYEHLRTLGPENSVERALLSRAAHYATMYSMIFAVMDMTTLITAKHLEAALAWVDYWHQSIKYIYKTESKKAKKAELDEKGEKVFSVIEREIKLSEKKYIGKTPITKAFSGKYSPQEISEVIDYLKNKPNPRITVERLPRNALKISLCI